MNPSNLTIKQSSAVNLLGASAPLVFTLLTLPLLLPLVGEFRYGALQLLWTLIGYLGVMDLGLGRATNNLIAKLDEASDQERANVLGLSLLLSAGMGLAGGLVLYALGGWLFGSVFTMEAGLRLEVLDALPLLVIALPLATSSSVLAGALEGRQAFVSLNIANVLGAIAAQVLPLLVALAGGVELVWLMLAMLAGRLLSALLLWRACRRHVSVQRPRWSSATVKKLLHFGGWVSVSSFLHPILTMTDRLVIGHKLDMAAVTTYTIPSSIATRLSLVPGSLASVLFPRFSGATSGEEAAQLMLRARLPLAIVMTPVIVAGMLLAEPLMSLWLGERLGEDMGPVTVILLAGIWINALAFIPFAYLQGLGRPDLTAKLHLAEVLPYLLILWWAIDLWGVEGAAAAWSLRVAIDAILLFILAGGGWPDRFPVLLGALLVLATAFIALLPMGDTLRLALSGLILLATGTWLYKSMPEELRTLLGSIRRKLSVGSSRST